MRKKIREIIIRRIELFLLLFFLLISILVVLFFIERNMVTDMHNKALQALADDEASLINDFFVNQNEKLSIIGSMTVFKDAVLYPDDPATISIAKNQIDALKDLIPGISLMSSQGIVSIGDNDLPGTDYSEHPYYLAKRHDVMFTEYYDPLRKGYYYAIIGPINDTSGKRIIGRIAFDIPIEEINNKIIMNSISETVEVYLIDNAGMLLTESKYIGKDNVKGVMIQQIKSFGAVNCLNHIEKLESDNSTVQHEEKIARYKNYMGDEVMGAHAYVPSIKACVIVEQRCEDFMKYDMIDYIKKIL